MDSQHRHDLKENDLANLLTGAKSVWNDKDWWTRYGNKILLVILVVAAIFLAKMWSDRRFAAAHEQQWADLSLANSPESYDAIASSYSDPAIKSLALLRSGDLLAARAASGESIINTLTDPAASQPSKVTTDPKQDATNAVLRYQEVVGLNGVTPLVRLNALLGMASAYETLGDWAKASTTYEEVQSKAKDVSPVLEVRAKNRLAMLPRLSEPVIFAPEPVVTSTPETQGGPLPLPGLGTLPMPAQKKPVAEPATEPAAEPAAPEAAAPAAE